MKEISCIVEYIRLFESINSVLNNFEYYIIYPRYGDEFKWIIIDSLLNLNDHLEEKKGVNCFYLIFNNYKGDIHNIHYLDDVQDFVIEFDGGRKKDFAIELTTIRLLSKKSKVKTIFKKIKKVVELSFIGRGAYLNDYLYDDIIFSDGLEAYSIWENIETKEKEITTASPAGPAGTPPAED